MTPASPAAYDTGGTPHEGMDVADINLDGKPDIVGAGYWFEHVGDKFEAHRITDRPFARSAAGQLVPGGRPEVVIVPGDADGRVEWFQWDGKSWVGRELLAHVVHGEGKFQEEVIAVGNANHE